MDIACNRSQLCNTNWAYNNFDSHTYFLVLDFQNAFLWCLTVRSVSTVPVVGNVEMIFMLSLTNPKWFAFEAVQITSWHLTQATLEASAKSYLQVSGVNQCSSVLLETSQTLNKWHCCELSLSSGMLLLLECLDFASTGKVSIPYSQITCSLRPSRLLASGFKKQNKVSVFYSNETSL